MTRWLLAVAIGIAVALVGYAPALRNRAPLGWLALARAIAGALIAAVALGAPVPGTASTARLVALDVSESWTRASDARAGAAATDSAARVAGGAGQPVAAAGESLRTVAAASAAALHDRASRVAAAAESAATTGVPLVLVTDGEIDATDALARAPAGSRALVLTPTRASDAALLELDAPSAVAPGDTATVAATIGADAAGSGAARVAWRIDGRTVAERPLAALAPFGRTTLSVRLPFAADARARTAVLDVVVAATGDREPRNDTLARAVEVTAAPRAVLVSTAPDYDVSVALGVLRGALAVPVRAYYRVAPGTWRVAGTLAPARESDVRAAAAGAALLVIHGDTAGLGAPRAVGRGALALVPAPATSDSGADWYAAPSPAPGPLGVLGGLAWDSLPPIGVAAGAPDAAAAVARLGERWTGVLARVGRRGAARAIVAGGVDPTGRRIAVVAAGGFWRWAFRGGAGAAAAPAVWGAVFDWLSDAPATATQRVVPGEPAVRSGVPISWRGVSPRDSSARVRLMPRAGGAPITLALRRDAADGEMRSDSPAPGVYDVAGGGVLVVNASAELLPRRPTLRSGPIGTARGGALPPASTPLSPGWPLAAATLLLCAEWVARRRLGLR